MSPSGAPDWVDLAQPPVPPEFAERLRAAGADRERPDVGALLDAARDELERALAHGGRREGAFHLLAADGLLTFACEGALSEELPAQVLAEIAGRACEAPDPEGGGARDEAGRRPGG